MNTPTLTFPSTDYGGSIGTVSPVFEFPPTDNFSLSENIRTGYLVDSAGSQALALLQEYLDAGASKRKAAHIDAGGGAHTWTLKSSVPVTQTKSDSSLYQWGYTIDDSVVNEASATGADPEVQMSVLMNAFRTVTSDSLTPATWSVGEYAPDGVLEDQVNVVIEQPEVVHESSRPNSPPVQLTLVETADLNTVFDASEVPE